MKKLVILSVISVIGMSCWSRTVVAQGQTQRFIRLSCTAAASAAQLCFSSSSSVVVHDGDEDHVHPLGFIFFQPALSVRINNIGCRNINDGADGPFQFFVLNVTLNGSETFRVLTFNMNCNSGGLNDFISLPILADNTRWFTEDLEVTVELRQDVGIHLLDILEGTD